jgi:hypothetical protein
MAIPTQGGLSQASSQPPAQAGANVNADAVEALNIQNQNRPTGLKEKVVDDLGDQRKEMNEVLLRLRAGLDDRRNRPFDPVLMQAAAGFLKPTKTGSFGESLGYAAEGAGASAEREAVQQRENQKLEMELAAKEMEFRQQLGGDQLVSQLLGGPRTAGAPAGTAVTTPTGGLRVVGAGAPTDVANADKNVQDAKVLSAAQQGRIKITDEVLLLANRVAPKMLPALQEIRKSQEGEEKNAIEREKFEQTTRKVIPRGTKTERDMTVVQQRDYQNALDNYMATGDEQKYLQFLDSRGWLDFEQARGRKIPKAGEGTSEIPRAKSQSEMEAEKETATQTAKERAKSAEEKATKLATMADSAFDNQNTAKDMIGFARNNPRVFELMNQPGIGGAVMRSIQQGISMGNLNINLPIDKLAQYKLSQEDLDALQMFAQKSAQLSARGRQLNRTPGEGAISDYETKLFGSIYALPSDSPRAIVLKSEALILQSQFDEARFKLWTKKSKEAGYTYNDFMVDDDYKELKNNYRQTLDKVREDNLDLLSPKKKSTTTNAPSSTPAQTQKAPTTQPATRLPVNDPSVPPGYIRDPQTGVIRKKREGE